MKDRVSAMCKNNDTLQDENSYLKKMNKTLELMVKRMELKMAEIEGLKRENRQQWAELAESNRKFQSHLGERSAGQERTEKRVSNLNSSNAIERRDLRNQLIAELREDNQRLQQIIKLLEGEREKLFKNFSESQLKYITFESYVGSNVILRKDEETPVNKQAMPIKESKVVAVTTSEEVLKLISNKPKARNPQLVKKSNCQCLLI